MNIYTPRAKKTTTTSTTFFMRLFFSFFCYHFSTASTIVAVAVFYRFNPKATLIEQLKIEFENGPSADAATLDESHVVVSMDCIFLFNYPKLNKHNANQFPAVLRD